MELIRNMLILLVFGGERVMVEETCKNRCPPVNQSNLNRALDQIRPSYHPGLCGFRNAGLESETNKMEKGSKQVSDCVGV